MRVNPKNLAAFIAASIATIVVVAIAVSEPYEFEPITIEGVEVMAQDEYKALNETIDELASAPAENCFRIIHWVDDFEQRLQAADSGSHDAQMLRPLMEKSSKLATNNVCGPILKSQFDKDERIMVVFRRAEYYLQHGRLAPQPGRPVAPAPRNSPRGAVFIMR